MEVQIAVVKIDKWASSPSGDTVEVIERPQGGLSIVMADGQGSGPGAKLISVMVARKVIALLADGVRDGAAARAASDYLFTERRGRVSATLNILSIDLHTRTLVITRNNPSPMLLAIEQDVRLLSEPSQAIGVYRDTRPVISEVTLTNGLTAVIFTDGLVHAGSRTGQNIDIQCVLESLLEEENPSPQHIADTLLKQALLVDENRPADDISIAALRVTPHAGDTVRRLTVRLPLET